MIALALLGAVGWSCDVDCVKAVASQLGADVVTGGNSDSLKYNIEVTYSAAADSGPACGMDRTYPAVPAFVADPSVPTKVTSAETREAPMVRFTCTPGKFYFLYMVDTLNVWQDWAAYPHWLRANLECAGDGTGDSTTGKDLLHPGGILGYLPPANPFNEFNAFNFFLFERDTPYSDEELDAFGPEIAAVSDLSNGKATLGFFQNSGLQPGAPVARTWIQVTTSFWAETQLNRLGAKEWAPWFIELVCPCNEVNGYLGLPAEEGGRSCATIPYELLHPPEPTPPCPEPGSGPPDPPEAVHKLCQEWCRIGVYADRRLLFSPTPAPTRDRLREHLAELCEPLC